MLSNIRLTAALLWLLTLAVILTGCITSPAARPIRLDDIEQATAIPRNDQPTLRIAIGSVISPKGTLASYSALVDYLGERVGLRGELIQRPTYGETNDLVRRGEVDLALVCSGAYVVGKRDFGMELLAMPVVNGQTNYYSYIVVPKAARTQSIADLRGKVFAFTDPLSNSGRLAPVYLLLQMGERPEAFFQKTIYTYSHDNSLKAVADGLVDGAAVDSLVYDYALAREPRYAESLRIIFRSAPFGIPPLVVPPQLSPERKQQLRQVLLNMHTDPDGRAILSDLMIERFVPAQDEAYASIREMVNAVGQER